MKTIIRTLTLITFLILSSNLAEAQTKPSRNQTAEFKVSGVCDMCKTRIEKAALINGVKFANWNKETGQLKLVYNARKTKEKDIHKALSEAGHDTEKVKADSISYEKLPGCCSYREDHVHKH